MKQSRNLFPLLIVLASAMLLGACAHYGRSMAACHGDETGARGVKYVCMCKPGGCGCNTVSDRPGNCPCGKPLLKKHVIREDDKSYWFCPCPAECPCAKADAADPAKCGQCGMVLKETAKRGAYVCGCGSGCGCDYTSNKPGNCPCGKPLVPAPQP